MAAQVRRHLFHGLQLQFASPRGDVLEAIEHRFGRFPTGPAGPADISFEYHFPDSPGALPEPPAVPRRLVLEFPHGEVTYSAPEGTYWVDCGTRARVTCRPAAGRVDVWADPAAADLWLLTRPLLTLPLLECLRRRGCFSVHAGGVRTPAGALLVAGGSGSGKSTLAVALAASGLPLLSDDTVFLAPGAGGPEILPFPEDVDLLPQSAPLLGEAGPRLRARLAGPLPPGFRKHAVPIEELAGGSTLSACPAALLVFARVSHRPESRLRPIEPGEALLELAPNVVLTEPALAQAHLDRLAALVSSCSCHRLETGTDLGAAVAMLVELAGRRLDAAR